MPDTRPLRVAMVTARTVPFMGGIETHVAEVARRLAARGVDLEVLTTDVTGALPADERYEGYRVRRFPAYPRAKDYYLSPGLLAALGRGRYDLVHVQGVHNAVPPLALAVAAARRLPSVLTFHTGGNSSPLRTAVRGAQWWAEAPLLRRATRLVAVCEHEVEQFTRRLACPPGTIRLVRNGADPLPVAAEAPEVTGAPLICSVGRLERYKGHHRVLAALPHVLADAPGAHLAIVGRGPYEAELAAQARALGVEHAVSIQGFGPEARPSMGALVASADVVALLSEYEAHPVAVMEALGAGVDVLVADTSGLSELGRAGLVDLVALDAPAKDVARALLATAAADRWAGGPPKLPSWEDCAGQLLDLYEEVAACGS